MNNMDLKYNLIIATDVQNGFGCKGFLPWTIPKELKYFKHVTSFNTNPSKKNLIVMGRKTWESIPVKLRPLSNRINIVFTKDQNFINSNKKIESTFYAVGNLFDYENILEELNDIRGHTFVIGGKQIIDYFHESYSNQCKYIFHTLIEKEYNQCDVFYEINNNFDFIIESEKLNDDTEKTSYCFRIFKSNDICIDSISIEEMRKNYILDFLG